MSKNQKPLASARISQNLMEQLEAIAEASGKSKSQILEEALAAHFGHATPESVQSLAKRVAALERGMQKLTALVAGS